MNGELSGAEIGAIVLTLAVVATVLMLMYRYRDKGDDQL